jgi:hypothetical protein
MEHPIENGWFGGTSILGSCHLWNPKQNGGLFFYHYTILKQLKNQVLKFRTSTRCRFSAMLHGVTTQSTKITNRKIGIISPWKKHRHCCLNWLCPHMGNTGTASYRSTILWKTQVASLRTALIPIRSDWRFRQVGLQIPEAFFKGGWKIPQRLSWRIFLARNLHWWLILKIALLDCRRAEGYLVMFNSFGLDNIPRPWDSDDSKWGIWR